MTPAVLLVYTVKFGKSLGSNRGSAVIVLAIIEDPPCYSCIQSSPVKVLAVITDRKHLHKMWKIHCHLRYGYFLAVNQIVMTTVEFVSDHFNLGVIEVPPCYSCIQSSPVQVLAVIEYPSCYSCIQGARVAQWVRSLDLTAHTSLSPIRRGFAPSFVNTKKGALDMQSQGIELISCLPRIGGSLRVFRLPPPLKLVTMIKLKYCWKWR
jgi:hypothetical protein